MATIHKSRWANLRFYSTSRGLFEGSLLKICSYRTKAYSMGGFRGGGGLGNSRIYGNLNFPHFRKEAS